MSVGAAFIRGINVGGNRSLPMETLRALCERVGMKDARTLIQSGNVVFRCAPGAMADAATALERVIETKFGFRPSVLTRSLRELRSVCKARVFKDHDSLEPGRLLVMFLAEAPGATAIKNVRRFMDEHACPERFVPSGREVFLYFPVGVAAAKLPMAKVEKLIGSPGTCRNWNTVNTLLGMAEELFRAAS